MLRYWSSNNRYQWLGEEKQYYIYNHLATCGLGDVVGRVAKRLNMSETDVITVFWQMHKRKKANQLAG